MTMLLPDKGITEVINEQKRRLRTRLSKVELIDLKRQLKPVLYNIIEHYQDSAYDICNVQVEIMNLFWAGKKNEKIKGGRIIQDLHDNRRLYNLLMDYLIFLIYSDKVSHYLIDEVWNNPEREERFSNNKQFCWSCKLLTHQYENTCPKCNGFVLQSKGKEYQND